MGLVPKLEESCFCCTLKTGSFTTAFFLLVGSSVQVGYYAFLVDHMNPQEMCTGQYYVYVRNQNPYHGYDIDIYDPLEGSISDAPFWVKGWRPKGGNASNTTIGKPENSSHAANTTDGEQGDTSYAANSTNSTGGEPANLLYAANTTGGEPSNSSYADNTTVGEPTNSSNAARHRKDSKDIDKRSNRDWLRGRVPPWWRNPWGFLPVPRIRQERVTYLKPCPRDYYPFFMDNESMDFDLRGDFDKTILYFNIAIWAAMMAATVLLTVGVYKESPDIIAAWLLSESLLLMVATASTVATSTLMFPVVPVQIGIVTLLNMAIHLGLNIYFMMVVANFRRQLTTKTEGDDTETEQVTVS